MRQEILYNDTLRQCTDKLNAMFDEFYDLPTASITGVISLTSSAFGKIHYCSGSDAHYTVDLPTAIGNAGQSIVFKGITTLTKIVTIQPVLGQRIDGEIDRQISTGGMISLLSDGTDWVVMDETGSWISYTPVLAGWSSDMVLDRAMYFRVGKSVTVQIHAQASGTSNASTKTITVPFEAAGGALQLGLTSANVNGGSVQTTPGLLTTRANSNIVDCYVNLNNSPWSGGDLGCRLSFTFNYVMQ